MYTRGITCFSCHDVHGTENNADLLKPASVMCLLPPSILVLTREERILTRSSAVLHILEQLGGGACGTAKS
jgi:predicted CXXCH cytochrome family protein